VMLQVDYEPEGMMENIGEALGMAKGRMESDLERFRDFIEARQGETGAWRGEVRPEEERDVA
jgi:predicted hydrocarbon binding protein